MNNIPSLQISSVERLGHFVSQRPAVKSTSSSYKPRLRLTVAGMLPEMKRWGVARSGLEPMDIRSPMRSATSQQENEQPKNTVKQPPETTSSFRPEQPRITDFFHSLLNKAMVPKASAQRQIAQKPAESMMVTRADKRSSQEKSLSSRVQPLQRLVDRAAQSPSQNLPAGLRDFLGGRLKKWLPSVQIHQGPAADELTSVMKADAVTFGNKIAFRHRRYQPDRPHGVALLGHELAHVAHAAAPGQAMSFAADERAALSHEHQIFHELSKPRVTQQPSPLAIRTPAPTPLAETTMIRTAHENRTIPSPTPGESEPITERQLADLKDQVYRDLLQRLRTDFERGS